MLIEFLQVCVCVINSTTLDHICVQNNAPFICLTGYTGSWRIQWEVSEAVEDMGLATAFVFVSSLPDHMCSCVFLVPAWTGDGAAHIVSSLSNISSTVSTQDSQQSSSYRWLHFSLNYNNNVTNQLFFCFPSRIWLLRKMLIFIFSRRTEKNSKICFPIYA